MSAHNTRLAAVWMLGALLSFSIIAIAVKELADSLSPGAIIFFRSIIGLLVLAPLLVHYGGAVVHTRRAGRHFVRNLAHFFGQYGWIVGIAYIPLAEVFALEFTVPIWTAIIAVILLGERLTPARLGAIGCGIVGVLVILRPGAELVHLAALAVIGGAICYGLAHTLTRDLSASDSSLSVIFYMSLFQLPMGLALALPGWVMPQGTMWIWLVIAGIAALLAHYCMARALTLADAVVVVPMDFLRLPLIMLVGYLWYNESVDLFVLLGALLMLAGNYLTLRSTRKPSI